MKLETVNVWDVLCVQRDKEGQYAGQEFYLVLTIAARNKIAALATARNRIKVIDEGWDGLCETRVMYLGEPGAFDNFLGKKVGSFIERAFHGC